MAADLTPAVIGIMIALIVCIVALLIVSAYYFCSPDPAVRRRRPVPGQQTTTVTYRQIGNTSYVSEFPTNAQFVSSTSAPVMQRPVMAPQTRIYLPDVAPPLVEQQPITGVYGRTMPTAVQQPGDDIVYTGGQGIYNAGPTGGGQQLNYTIADVHQAPTGLIRTTADYYQ